MDASKKVEVNKVAFIVGIDPGADTGFAVFERATATYIKVKTLDFHQVMQWADDVVAANEVANYMLVVECPRIKTVYSRLRGEIANTPAAELKALRVGRNVGSNNRESELLLGELERRGFYVVGFAPDKQWKQAKWSEKQVFDMTGYKGRSSEHSRDAIRMVEGHKYLARVKSS